MATHMQALIKSSVELLRRFGVKPTADEQLAVFDEEVAEVHEALKAAKNATGEKAIREAREALAEELVDVMVSGINTVIAAGVTPSQVSRAVKRVIEKNNAKSDKTHAVDEKTGKITRLSKS